MLLLAGVPDVLERALRHVLLLAHELEDVMATLDDLVVDGISEEHFDDFVVDYPFGKEIGC